MEAEKVISGGGEEGNRRGTEFENAIIRLISILGYKIIRHNFNIECLKKTEHKGKEHGIDILVRKPFKTHFPNRIPRDYETLIISCKSTEGGKVEESDVNDLINSMACYDEINKTKVGGLLITTGNFSKGALKILNTNKSIAGWDLRYVIFISAFISNYGVNLIMGRIKLFVENSTYILESRRLFVPIFPVKGLVIFDENEGPMNHDRLNKIIGDFSKKNSSKLCAFYHVEIHSLNGFTKDVSEINFNKKRWKFFSLSAFGIESLKFIDYTFPWDVLLKFDLIYSHSKHKKILKLK